MIGRGQRQIKEPKEIVGGTKEPVFDAWLSLGA